MTGHFPRIAFFPCAYTKWMAWRIPPDISKRTRCATTFRCLASGLPLIAPASGGVTSFANAKNAILTEPTGAAFASAIRELAFNPAKRRAMVNEAVNTARQHSWGSITDQFLQLYESLHRIQRGELGVDSANPFFVSPRPSTRQKYTMSAAATVAKNTFIAVSRIVGLHKAAQLTVTKTAEQR